MYREIDEEDLVCRFGFRGRGLLEAQKLCPCLGRVFQPSLIEKSAPNAVAESSLCGMVWERDRDHYRILASLKCE